MDSLTNLTDLSFYSNRIQELSGLDNLSKLNVLSLGCNLFTQYVQVIEYLKSFSHNIQVLTLKGNECASTKDEYRKYVVAFLQNLKYLDYEVIDQGLREAALEKHKDEIKEVDTKDAKEQDD